MALEIIQPVSNVNATIDINHTTQYTRWLLESLGVWPMLKKNPRRREMYVSKMLMTLGFALLGFILVPSTMHAVSREKDPIVRLLLWGPIGFCLTNILKYCSIILRRDSIKLCIEHLEADWTMIENADDREIMLKNVNVGRGLTAICGIFMYTGGISFHTIMPIFRGTTTNDLNETIRPLVYPGYDIFIDVQSSPTYEIVFYTNCLSACVTYTVTTAACNLAAIFVTHSCGQIQIMMSRLDKLFDKDGDDDVNDETLRNRVGFVIRCHVRVLRFTTIVERVLREILLVEVVASTIIICLLEFAITGCMVDWDNSEMISMITYVMLLMSLTFNIFIFCHIGELLKEKCSEVGKATYMVDWYKLPAKTALALIMIIAMANYPRKITAGGMMELSVTSFGAIIKTSVCYLNMLRTVGF